LAHLLGLSALLLARRENPERKNTTLKKWELRAYQHWLNF
jgi:hypothetical protein